MMGTLKARQKATDTVALNVLSSLHAEWIWLVDESKARLRRLYVEFVFSLRACVGFLRVLQLHPTINVRSIGVSKLTLSAHNLSTRLSPDGRITCPPDHGPRDSVVENQCIGHRTLLKTTGSKEKTPKTRAMATMQQEKAEMRPIVSTTQSTF